jgi:hypothetical protein
VGCFLSALAAAGDCHDAMTFTRLNPEAGSYAETTGMHESGQFVLRNAQEWAAMWQRIHSGRRPAPPLPELDFDREMMIVVASGRHRTGGYAIRIDEAWREGDRTIIVVHEETPAESCIVPMAITSPVDIARLPLAPEPVVFRLESRTRACG